VGQSQVVRLLRVHERDCRGGPLRPPCRFDKRRGRTRRSVPTKSGDSL
jgi:hypothetical protein